MKDKTEAACVTSSLRQDETESVSVLCLRRLIVLFGMAPPCDMTCFDGIRNDTEVWSQRLSNA